MTIQSIRNKIVTKVSRIPSGYEQSHFVDGFLFGCKLIRVIFLSNQARIKLAAAVEAALIDLKMQDKNNINDQN